MADVVNLGDVQKAAERIDGFARKTEIMTSQYMNDLSDRQLYFKCENFQKTGSFKFRGALNAVDDLISTESSSERSPGVITHSAGNFAQGVALAAKLRNLEARIIMPENAPACKKAAVRDYGAQIVECIATDEGRQEKLKELQQVLGSNFHFLSSNQDIRVIAGQGTAALEFLNEVPKLDAIVVPVGGGGLLSGTAIAAKSIKPEIKVFAAEPAAACDCYNSLSKGELLPNASPPQTIADGLRTSIGKTTWPIIRKYVDRVILVSEEEIVCAMKLIWERMKLVVEPSGAVPLAAVLTEEFRTIGGDRQHVGIILSGGNLDLERLPWLKGRPQ
ncbi:serine racemase-like isoform X1 [Oscarella lobularis]|uniref:serine racemase-like isoform X1 n=1 Tax=Oscarella lobularis TaxID=121494 RepID=UPI003313E004